MNINKHPDIAGIPARKLRDALRRMNRLHITGETLADRLRISLEEATSVVARLLEEKYLTQSRDAQPDEVLYETTLLGNGLMSSSAAPKMSRQTANRNLAEFMRRVGATNSDSGYVFTVCLVILFGSMVTSAASVSDIDLVIRLDPRKKDPAVHQELFRKRIADAHAAGKSFPSFNDQLLWPRHEIYKLLKWKLRGISLHELDDFVGIGLPEYRVLLGDERWVREMIKSAAGNSK